MCSRHHFLPSRFREPWGRRVGKIIRAEGPKDTRKQGLLHTAGLIWHAREPTETEAACTESTGLCHVGSQHREEKWTQAPYLIQKVSPIDSHSQMKLVLFSGVSLQYRSLLRAALHPSVVGQHKTNSETSLEVLSLVMFCQGISLLTLQVVCVYIMASVFLFFWDSHVCEDCVSESAGFFCFFFGSFYSFYSFYWFVSYSILLIVFKCLFSKEREKGGEFGWVARISEEMGRKNWNHNTLHEKKSIFNKTKIGKNRQEFPSKMRLFIKHLKSSLSTAFLILPSVPLSLHAGMVGCLWEGAPIVSCILACAIMWFFHSSLYKLGLLSNCSRQSFQHQSLQTTLTFYLCYLSYTIDLVPLGKAATAPELCGEAPVTSDTHPS